MDPAAALSRIAYLLEREREPTYRVRAYRTAAAAIARLPPGELRQRAARGRLRDLPGIGEKTERVVTEALAGEVPSYLRRLEEAPSAVPPLDGEAAELRRRLQGDCHTHSDWSDGGSPIHEMASAARDLGHAWMALTDHSPRLTVAKGLSAERLRRQLEVVEQLNRQLAPFGILTGIEVDILPDGTLDQDDELLARLDVVVASAHSQLRMDREGMTARLLRAVANPHVDVLGHCTGRLVTARQARTGTGAAAGTGRGRPESDFDAEAVFAACVRFGTAVEINSRPERLDPPRRLLRRAVEMGCLLAVDSDAHAPGQLEWQPYGCERAAACGASPEMVVNTWDAGRLLAWTATHPR